MESRVERNKRVKIDRKNRRIRVLAFVICIMFFLINLYRVDIQLREIMCITDKRILDVGIEKELYRLHIFGSDYVIYKEQIDAILDNAQSHIQQLLRTIDEYKDRLIDN